MLLYQKGVIRCRTLKLLWMLSSVLFTACTVEPTFIEEQELYQTFQRATKTLAQGNREDAVALLHSLHLKYPDSRAVLEQLLSVYVDGSMDDLDVGLTLVDSFVLKHPGDSEIRIQRARLLLGLSRFDEAIKELQVVLFNRKIHPWILARDGTLRKFQEELAVLQLPFEGIVPIDVAIPTSVLLGDTGVIEIEALHSRQCGLEIEAFMFPFRVELTRLQVHTDMVDDVVQKTAIQLHVHWLEKGLVSSLVAQLKCGEDRIHLTQNTLEVLSVDSGPSAVDEPSISFTAQGRGTVVVIPTVDVLKQDPQKIGVPWKSYVNGILDTAY